MPCKDREAMLAYHRDYNRKRYAANKEREKTRVLDRRAELTEWLQGQKVGKVCSECGFSDVRALDYHHLGDKSFNLGNAAHYGYGKKRIEEEIAKCVLLCANCHRIHHSPP